MNLKAYLDLYEVLQHDRSTREERRNFGLSSPELSKQPLQQLLKWASEKRVTLKKPLLSETLSSYLYGITLTLSVFAFILGLLSGVGLLSYNGHEPVNVIYFMAMVIFVPLFTMLLALFSMLRANSAQSILVHISPAYWMERMVSLLPNKLETQLKGSLSDLKVSPLVLNWLVIKRSQMIALSFSLGLLLALLGVVATRDIAFAWSTTLSVSPESFHSFLNTLAFAWRDFFPWAVPSVELVEQSQYYRLGEKLADEMISNASFLGEWWKFLLFATLFYALVLRLFVYALSVFGLKRAIARSFLTLEGAQALLHDMNEPLISTRASTHEKNFNSGEVDYPRTVDRFDRSYDAVLGWAIDRQALTVINETTEVISPALYEAGGANTLEEDRSIIEHCHGEVLLYVKAWEPPTMDFMDFLEMLLQKTDKVLIAPMGTQSRQYQSKEKDLNVWARKLFGLNSPKVWLKV